MAVRRSRPMAIGAYIRARRQELGLSLKELSKRSQIGYTYLSKIEHDHVNPSPSAILKLADGLDVPYDVLLAYTGLPLRSELRGSGTKPLRPERQQQLEEVRIQAILALGKIGVEIPNLLDLLKEMLAHQDLRVRASAAQALGEFRDVSAVLELMHLVANPGREAEQVSMAALEEILAAIEAEVSPAGTNHIQEEPVGLEEPANDSETEEPKRQARDGEGENDDIG